MAAKPSRDTLIHCDACGEDYSSTYRRCPFCGARNDPRRAPREDAYDDSYDIPSAPMPSARRGGDELEDGYVFDGQDAFEDEDGDEDYYTPRPKGGKRLAPKQGGGFDLPPVNWPRLITFLCSLVIIVAALVIVFTFIYPKLRGSQTDPKTDSSAAVSDVPSQSPATLPTQPADPVDSVDPGTDPSQAVPPVSAPPVQAAVTGIVLKTSEGRQTNDFTLGVGQSAQLTAEVSPAGWTGPVTWTSSNTDWITVSSTGLVTNVNQTGSYHNAYITVTAGDVTVRCEVRVRAVPGTITSTPAPADSQPPASQPPASQAPSTGGSVIVGRPGTIVGADGGLRVRGGPGTTYEVLASLNNGDPINVVADAGGGWYEITLAGRGETITGYIMGEYISSN